jgi:RHS repeat-associated protein
MIFQQDAEGFHMTSTYNQFSEVIFNQDKNGKVRNYIYGDGVNLTEIQEPLGRTTDLAYFPSGLTKTVTDANGHVTSFDYDKNGNLDSFADAIGAKTDFNFDDKSRMINRTDALRQTTTFSFNDKNQLTQKLYADGTSRAYSYDLNGDYSLFVNENSNSTQTDYDLDDNGMKVTEANGAVTQATYDPENNNVLVTNANGAQTQFAFNNVNLIKSEQDPLGRTKTYSYDNALLLKNIVNERGTMENITRFSNNRIKLISFNDTPITPSIGFNFDGNGDIIQMNDAEGQKNYLYDDLNELKEVDNLSQSFVLKISYDLAGRKIARENNKVPGIVSFSYDAANRVTAVTDTDGSIVKYSYNLLGQETKKEYPGGIAHSDSSYNENNHSLVSLVTSNSLGEVISSFDYHRNAVKDITHADDFSGGTTYNYDAVRRLIEVENINRPMGNINYEYDFVGNRTKLIENSVPMTAGYDAADEIQSFGSTTFTHDLSGNMTGRLTGSISTTYSWDALNRLSEARQQPGNILKANFIYDGFNERVRKTNGGGDVKNYLFDRSALLLETDGAGAIKRSYNPNISTTDDKGNKFYYVMNGHGDVANLLDRDGNVVQSYTYDSFGAVIGLNKEFNGSRYVGNNGVYSDDDLGLQYMRNRWYDPQLGRFISRDPIGFRGGINLYVYVKNNPLNWVDPFGLDGSTPNTNSNPTPTPTTAPGPGPDTPAAPDNSCPAEPDPNCPTAGEVSPTAEAPVDPSQVTPSPTYPAQEQTMVAGNNPNPAFGDQDIGMGQTFYQAPGGPNGISTNLEEQNVFGR